MWSRLYIAPLLQAEEDRDQVRRYYADKEREKELLGSEMKVYNSDRYVSLSGVRWFLHLLIFLTAQLHPPYFRVYPLPRHQMNQAIVTLYSAMPPSPSAPDYGGRALIETLRLL